MFTNHRGGGASSLVKTLSIFLRGGKKPAFTAMAKPAHENLPSQGFS